MIVGAIPLYDVQQQVLTCATNALGAVTGVGAPNRIIVSPGPPTWDGCDCGLLAVSTSRIYMSQTFPIDSGGETSQRRCGNPYVCVDMSVTIARCTPVGKNGSAPTPKQESEAARILYDDAAAILSGVACCLQSMSEGSPPLVEDYVIRQQVVVGPEGGCVGTDTSLTLGFVNGCLCKE